MCKYTFLINEKCTLRLRVHIFRELVVYKATG